MPNILQWAIRYYQAGWLVFPCKNKRPHPQALEAWDGSWKAAIGDKIIDEKTIKWWWDRYPNAQIAVACGVKSGITVVDIDTKTDVGRYPNYVLQNSADIQSELPASLTSITGSGGRHVFYAYEDVSNSARSVHPQIDIRSEGGYVILPPSIHESGESYKWQTEWSEACLKNLPSFPEQLLAKIEKPNRTREQWLQITAGVGKGSRNVSTASLAGLLIRKLDPHIAWDLLCAWNNQNNRPPLNEEELFKTFNSIIKKQYGQ